MLLQKQIFLKKKYFLIIFFLLILIVSFIYQSCTTSTTATSSFLKEQNDTKDSDIKNYSGNLPWETAPFKAKPQTILDTAQTISLEKEQDVRILLREWYFKFDNLGRLEKQYKHVYQILSQKGVQNWASLQVAWDPWYQEKPQVRVRVSNPDGHEYFLNPAHIVENAERDQDATIFSDRRSLRAPYPNIAIGSVVEEEIIILEKPAFQDMGTVKRVYFSMNHPVHSFRTIIDVPAGLPFKYRLYLLPQMQPLIQPLKNGNRYVFELTNVPPDDKIEGSLPPDVPHWPALAFSTGESWNKTATRYSQLVDEKLKNENFTAYIAQLKGADAETTARNYLKWINSKIRYTGLELGENSIVPSLPSETLKRGFGDCKDKATLLVGMLRQAGYKAYVALLDAGTGWDIDDELPGIGQFNHAIVYLAEGNGLWLDPTAEYSREALIPASDQNRNALIAAPTTTKTVKTTKYDSTINRIIINKEFMLQDDGYADVKETNLFYGAHEEYQRYRYLGADKEKVTESFKKYITSHYRFGDLEKWDVTDSTDLNQPFQITIQIKKAGRAITEGNKAQLAVMVEELFSNLPDALTAEMKEDRVENFIFFVPSIYEINYIITPPLGFVYKNVPASETSNLGTVTLDKKFEVSKKEIRISLRLDTGKDRLSARDFKKTNEAILDFLKEKVIMVELEHEGEILLAKGNYKGSLASLQSYIQQEPNKVIHLIRYANALLQAGLGEKAREIALKATVLDPKSAPAQSALGWILEHDLLGRRFQIGFDRKGALEAYKKAIDLDNKNTVYRLSYAILSEYDGQGFRYSAQANLKDAIDSYQYVARELKDERGRENLLLAYMYAGQYDELQKLATELKEESTKNIFNLVAVTAKQGVDIALKEAAKINSNEQRKQALVEASSMLVRLRLYPQAVTILREAAHGSKDALQLESRADMLKDLKAYNQLDYNPQDVESVIKNYLYVFLKSDGEDFSRLKEFVSADYYKLATDKTFENNFKRDYIKFKNEVLKSNFTLEFFVDTTLSTLKFITDGDKNNGYRVKLRGSELTGQFDSFFYLDTVNGKTTITGNQHFESMIGKQIYQFYKNGQNQKAAQWLDWFFEDYATFDSKANEVLSGHPFQKFWNKEQKQAEYAALAIMSYGEPYIKEAVQLLEQAYKTEKKKEEKNNLAYALHLAYLTNKDKKKSIEAAEQLYTLYPDSERAFELFARALIYDQTFDKAEKLIKTRLDKNLTDKAAHNMLFFNYAYKADLAAMREQIEKCQKYNTFTAGEFNLAAWAELFGTTELDPKALEYARTAVMRTNSGSSAILHTLATLYAEVGRCEEARKLISQVMTMSGNEEPDSDDWFVIGRIAEHYGDLEAATKAYQHVEKPTAEENDLLSTFILAQRRLKVLAP